MSEMDKYFGNTTNILNRLDQLDASLLADLNVLYDKQRDTITILETMNKTMEGMVSILEKTAPVRKNTKGKSLLFWGGIALVGYAAYKYTEPKKEK